MRNLTENELYWSETWCEVLFNNGVDICVDQDTHEAIAKDFASNAKVQGNYMAPAQGECEIEKLKLKIKKLENRVPCTYCGGHGGSWNAVTSHHSSWDDCHHCNGKKWIQH